MDRLLKLKTLLGEPDEGVLQIVIETVEQMILNYINHEELPAALESVLISMCVSYYKSAGLGNSEPVKGPLASVKRGDTTFGYQPTKGAFDNDAGGDGFFGWRTQLNAFRKVRW